MAFCTKCGQELKSLDKFCSNCGNKVLKGKVNNINVSINTKKIKEKLNILLDKILEDKTDKFAKKDIQDNKIYSIMSYLGILSLVTYFRNKKSKFIEFHSKQGMNLFIYELIIVCMSRLLYSIKIPKELIYFEDLHVIQKVTPTSIKFLVLIINLCMFIVSLYLIITTLKGKAKKIKILEKIKIVK